jgi:hypothetical protein
MRFFRHVPSSSVAGQFLRTITALMPASLALFAQQAPLHHSHSTTSSIELTGDSPVIRIQYECVSQPSTGTCTSTVTKRDFDALVRALDPSMTADARQALAAEYSRLLIMGAEARRRGLDQLPEFQTLLQFSALQLLGTRLVKDIQGNVPANLPDEIRKYFRDHERDYRHVTLSRIVVPAHSPGGGQAGDGAAHAEQVRKRAVNGEDFTALQRDITGSEANTQIGPMSCRALPEAHRPVCDLPLKEVSPVIADNSGYSIYRLESKVSRELNEVRDEIRATLERRHLQEQIQKVRTPVSLDLDEKYFGKLPKPDIAHQHGMQFPAARTVSSEQTHQHRH